MTATFARPPVTATATAAGIALASLAAALAIRSGHLAGILVLAPLFAIAAVLWPRSVVLALIVFGATVFPQRFDAFGVGGIRSDVPELLAFVVIGVWLVRAALGSAKRESRFLLPVLGILLAAGIGASVGVANGATTSDVFGPLKTYCFWLLAPALTGLLGAETDLDWLERWIFRLSVVFSVLVLATAALGGAVANDDQAVVVTLGHAEAAQRLRPALLQLLFLTSLLLANRIVHRGMTIRRGAAAGLFAVVIALSFTRSTWAPLTVCLIAFAILRPGERKALRTTTVILVTVAIGAATITLAAAGALGPSAEALTLRARSVITPATLEDRSLTDREDETGSAIATLRQSPVTGVGIGRPYGARRGRYSASLGRRIFVERLFIHNSVLAVWLGLGVAGLAAFTALGVAVAGLARRVRADLRLPVEVRGRCLAGALTVAGMAAQGLFQTKLYHRPSLLVVGLGLVLLDVRRPGETA